jgi:hypothetical protein
MYTPTSGRAHEGRWGGVGEMMVGSRSKKRALFASILHDHILRTAQLKMSAMLRIARLAGRTCAPAACPSSTGEREQTHQTHQQQTKKTTRTNLSFVVFAAGKDRALHATARVGVPCSRAATVYTCGLL